MRYLVAAAPLLLCLTLGTPATAQYPGSYPPGSRSPYPGGYPTGSGIPFPRRSKDKAKEKQQSNQPQLQSLTGVLREIDESSLTIVAADTRTITAKRSGTTKFTRKGEPATAASLTPGDHVRIDATQDDEGFFHAVTVNVESAGTPQDKVEAASANPPSVQRSESDERPILRRNTGAPAEREPEPPKPAPPAPPPAVATAPAAPSAPQCPEEPDPGPPRLRRGKPPVRKTPAPLPPCVEPAAPAAPQPQVVASAAPVRVEKTAPDMSAPAEDQRIAKARRAVATYTQSLPNYFCQEQMARFVSTTPKVDWHPVDVLSATVVFENGRDEYRNLTVNGKPVNKKIEEVGGSWSTGEFGMMAADLFSRATAAEFTLGRSTTIANRSAVVYDFEVDGEHSHWNIQAPSQSMRSAYKGSVWLDTTTAEVLRIEMQTRRMPKEFPLDKVESAVDYENVRIGEGQYLLPVHSETLSCVRGTSNCSRNVIDFRNYRKYSGQSTITFDK